MTPLQRLRSMTLLPKTFRKTYLVILEAANTTYAPILILTTQKYTDIDVRKILIQPLFVRDVHPLPLSLSFFRTQHPNFFFFRGHVHIDIQNINSIN